MEAWYGENILENGNGNIANPREEPAFRKGGGLFYFAHFIVIYRNRRPAIKAQ